MFLFFALVAAARLWSGSKILDEILSNLIVEQLTTILFLYAYTYSIFNIKQISFRCKYIRVNILWILQCLSKNHLQQRYFSTVLYPWNLCSSLLHKFGFVRQPSHQTEPSKNHPRRLQPELWQSLNHPGQHGQNQWHIPHGGQAAKEKHAGFCRCPLGIGEAHSFARKSLLWQKWSALCLSLQQNSAF